MRHSLHNAPEYSRRTRHGPLRRRGVGFAELAGGSGPYGRGYSRVLAGTHGYPRYSAARVGARRRWSTAWVLAGTPGTARVLACNGCCGTAEGRVAVVPSCAGAYVSGDRGSNACPAGSARIETEAACRTAVAAAGKTPYPFFVMTSPYVPRGCYYNTNTDLAVFNPHAVGAGDFGYHLLCAALATTGAPLPSVLTWVLKGYSRMVLRGYSEGYSQGTHMGTHMGTGRGTGRGTRRVLSGYSKGTQMGFQTRVLNGHSEGYSKVVLKGYSQQRRKCFGCLRQYSWDRWVGSARQRCAHSEYGVCRLVVGGSIISGTP